MRRISYLGIILLLVFAGCVGDIDNADEQSASNETPTQEPTLTATFTNTPEPSNTLLPTDTPEPTLTPTQTPIPTGMVIIPDLSGMKRNEAYELLESLGLVPLTIWVIEFDEFVFLDVTDNEPPSGEVVLVGTEVILDVVGKVIRSSGGGKNGSCNPHICDSPDAFKFLGGGCWLIGASYYYPPDQTNVTCNDAYEYDSNGCYVGLIERWTCDGNH